MIEIEINLIGIIINSIIAVAAITTLIYQIIFNTKTLDYNLHPVFTINEFSPNNQKKWTPKLCEAAESSSKHYCTDDHWFNITNTDLGYAFKFSCFIIHKKEIIDDFSKTKFQTRIIKRDTLISNGTIQYKIPKDAIPFRFYNKSITDEIYIIIEYKTVNTKSKFRQIISLKCTPLNEKNQINDWKNAIKISFPEVVALKKISWWQNDKRKLISELKQFKD